MSNSAITRDGPSGPKPKKFITLPRVIVYGVLILCCLFFLFPLYIMVITSLKDLDAIREGNLFTPSSNLTIAPWIKAWSQACTGLYCEGIKPGFINSLPEKEEFRARRKPKAQELGEKVRPPCPRAETAVLPVPQSEKV